MSEDHEIFFLIEKELERQRNHIELIASENIVSKSVLLAQGSILTNKYAEGYPNNRYYQGCRWVDEIESIAINRAKELFSCKFANVQPHSGSQANQAVMIALLKPGDIILGMDLSSGGHLTHGAKVSMSGKFFNSYFYGVDPNNHCIDYDEVRKIAENVRPNLIIAGASSYPRSIDFSKFRSIADSVGAYFLADISHISGLVVSELHQSPLPYAHVVTSTTHKTLRGPRGGIILTNIEEINRKINSSVFPGVQGGPLVHTIAAKAVAFLEALQPSFKEYIGMVIKNASSLSKSLLGQNLKLVSGGTDTHLLLIDLRNFKITGKQVSDLLNSIHITSNMNKIPNDNLSASTTSGIRIGTPASTTRGLNEKDFYKIGEIIGELIWRTSKENKKLNHLKKQVIDICKTYPIYFN